MSIDPEKLMGKVVSYTPINSKEKKVSNIAGAEVLENIYGDLDVTFILANKDRLDAKDAYFDQSAIAIAKG